MAALEWRDVSFATRKIHLRAETTKSRRADVVRLHRQAFAELKAWKPDRVEATAKVLSRLPSSRVILADLKFAGVEAVRRDGEKVYVDFHALRKTLSTWMARERIDKRVRQAHLRHADSRLTDGTYLDASLLGVEEELEKLQPIGADVKAAGDGSEPQRERGRLCGS